MPSKVGDFLLGDYADMTRDSTVKVTFRQISDTVFACRHSVTVFWSKSQERIEDSLPEQVELSQKSSVKDKRRIIAVTVSMKSVATTDAAQSEAYVATAAAFLLFSQASKEERMYLKIGSAWRELWTEFVDVKNAKKDADDRETVKVIRKLVDTRIKEEEDNGFVFSESLRNMTIGGGDKQTSDSIQFSRERQDAFTAAHYIWQGRIFSQQYQYMLQFRNALPMAQFREHALNIINTNQITILCGETGCGKSTQLPAFIMEDQFMQGNPCKVLCTEPRRISAISLAHRVSQELGEQQNEVGTGNSLVGYAVRLESHIGPYSRLIYATVGVVLRMLEDLNGLNEYTHLIIDEVHERSIETDFLLIVLQKLCKRRPELKVVLMSATVDASRFSAYLDDAPIIDVPGRTFPVNTRFLEDAIELTKETGKGHKRLEEEDEDAEQEVSGISNELQGYSVETRNVLAEYDEYQINYQLIIRLMETIITQPDYAMFKKAILVFLPGIAEIREMHNLILNHHAFESNVLIYPLHSTVSSEEQQQAFVEPPEGMLKIVLATNIAETGVTIPDVTCVIDTGTHKEMRFDERRQLSRLVQSFISRANAKQRRGRAGRVQEGICFHLFTKKRHDELMANQQTPEMLRLSLQDLVMRVKMCGLGNIEETLSQALDPPSSKNIRRAIDALIEVGALTSTEELTTLGRQLVKMPLDAQLGKLVLLSAIFGCLDAGLTIAAILSSKTPFITPFGERQRSDAARQAFSRGDSDLLTSYNAYCGWRRVLDNTFNENIFAWCRKNFLSHQILSNIEDLKSQLYSSLRETGVVKATSGNATRSKPAHGLHGYKAAIRVPVETDVNSSNDIITTTVIAWSFYPKLLIRDSTSKGWRSISNSQTLSLHPTSVNRGNSKPKYLSFYSIMQSGNKFYNSTNAISTNIVHEVPLLLLAGEAEFKMHAGVLAIDSNRLRYVLKDWRTAVGMKTIRSKMEELVERAIEGKRLTEEMEWWKGIFIKICTKAEKDVQKIQQ
jgi:ATP-dependent RNA helicase DHX29